MNCTKHKQNTSKLLGNNTNSITMSRNQDFNQQSIPETTFPEYSEQTLMLYNDKT